MGNHTTTVGPLVALGFTEIEAIIYTYLVGNSPATGYRIAHETDKPIANTYKAIESLHQKGAVMVDDSGQNRQVRAVAPEELLDQLSRAFASRHDEASRALQDLAPSKADPGVYTLTHVEQVVSRAKGMLERAETIVVCDLFPRALAVLRADLERAAARGVTVAAKVYEPAEIDGVELVVSARGSDVIDAWSGQWMNLVIDETEVLLSILDEEGDLVRQGVWSGSPFLSVVYHVAFSWEITGARVEKALKDANVTPDEIRSMIADFKRLEAPDAHGYRLIKSR